MVLIDSLTSEPLAEWKCKVRMKDFKFLLSAHTVTLKKTLRFWSILNILMTETHKRTGAEIRCDGRVLLFREERKGKRSILTFLTAHESGGSSRVKVNLMTATDTITTSLHHKESDGTRDVQTRQRYRRTQAGRLDRVTPSTGHLI